MNYEVKAVEAFINNPRSFDWYYDTFKKFSNLEHKKPIWQWSWWAFLGGVWFLFYRKLYLEGLIIWLIGSLLTFTFGPVAMLPLMIALGGYTPWLIYRRFKKIKREVEYTTSDSKERLFLLEDQGGCNQLIIPIIIALLLASFFF